MANPNIINGDLLGYDVLNGTAGTDIINAFDGGSLIEGGAGGDIIVGGTNYGSIDTSSYEHSTQAVNIDLRVALQRGGDAEGDQLFNIEDIIGSAFNDTIVGDSNNNRIEGGAGLDKLSGGEGNDVLIGGFDGKADVVDGGSGRDTADYSSASAGMTIKLQQTNTFATQYGVFSVTTDGSAKMTSSGILEDVLRGVENAIGSAFNDVIEGNEQANEFQGGFGADIINGKGGIDTAVYTGLGATRLYEGVNVDLMRTVQIGGDAEGDRLISIENIIGGYADDKLYGDNSGNRLEGNSGNDTIFGRGGADVIDGGFGSDTLDGGAGADTFLYSDINVRMSSVSHHHWRRSPGTDTIENFETGIDKIDLRAIDANRLVEGNNAFVFADSFSGSAGQLVLTGGVLTGDVDGDKVADITINVAGAKTTDFLL